MSFTQEFTGTLVPDEGGPTKEAKDSDGEPTSSVRRRLRDSYGSASLEQSRILADPNGPSFYYSSVDIEPTDALTEPALTSASKFPRYSQSKAPFIHSYINPTVNINKKTIIDQKPKIPILFKETAQGKRKVTSKSKIINKIDTR